MKCNFANSSGLLVSSHELIGQVYMTLLVCLLLLLLLFFVVALRPKSTAMVMVGQSVHLTTFFPGQARTSS